jgi:hypothetical protein
MDLSPLTSLYKAGMVPARTFESIFTGHQALKTLKLSEL